MKTKYLVYGLAILLMVSLVANELLYENVQSLQRNLNEYSDANNNLIQKASMLSSPQSGPNATSTPH